MTQSAWGDEGRIAEEGEFVCSELLSRISSGETRIRMWLQRGKRRGWAQDSAVRTMSLAEYTATSSAWTRPWASRSGPRASSKASGVSQRHA